jgi:hypothetical protein
MPVGLNACYHSLIFLFCLYIKFFYKNNKILKSHHFYKKIYLGTLIYFIYKLRKQYIYTLTDPISNIIRYVGKSNNPHDRLKTFKDTSLSES